MAEDEDLAKPHYQGCVPRPNIAMQRRAAELHRAGHQIQEIAEIIGCSKRTVHRWLSLPAAKFK